METMVISADRWRICVNRDSQQRPRPVSMMWQTLSSLSRSPPGPDIMPSISFSILMYTTSSAGELLASNRQFVIPSDSSCMASGSLGESLEITLYDRNLVTAMSASDVIDADVEDDRMTWRNGWSSAGVSNVLMSASR
jgi:hypothetical protein